MMDFFSGLVNAQSMEAPSCASVWQPAIGLLHASFDAILGLSCASIGALIVVDVVRQRPLAPFSAKTRLLGALLLVVVAAYQLRSIGGWGAPQEAEQGYLQGVLAVTGLLCALALWRGARAAARGCLTADSSRQALMVQLTTGETAGGDSVADVALPESAASELLAEQLKEERVQRIAAEAQLTRLEEAQLELRRISRIKDDFLAMVSHELRTPMNAIMGWTELLRNGHVEAAEVNETYEILYRNAQAQAKLVDDVLDISRVISGKLRLHMQDVLINDVINQALDTMQLAAEAKSIRLVAVAVSEEAAQIWGDRDRLRQVVLNLLGNAIKFTGVGGQIEVAHRSEGGKLELSVTDSGVGIEADFLPFVFERFLQEDSGRIRRHGGLGLGLSITRHIVELHGGSIQAESAGKNKGARFLVTLPVSKSVRNEVEMAQEHSKEVGRASAMRPKALGQETQLEGIRVLFVDDDPDTRVLLVKVLRRAGALVTEAASASEAINVLQKEALDVLISDIGMPGTDGYEFVKQARKVHTESGRSIPAIALTAFARIEDRKAALAAGFQEHLSKPVDFTKLISTVAKLSAS